MKGRKIIGAGMSLILAVAFSAPGAGTALAQATGSLVTQSSASSMASIAKKATSTSKVKYKEGSVLVRYKSSVAASMQAASTTAKAKSLGTMALDSDDMQVTKVYDFGVEDSTASSGYSTQSVSNAFEIAVVTSSTMTSKEMVASLKKNSNVAKVSYNYLRTATDVDLTSYQWSLENTGQFQGTAGTSSNAETAWNKGVDGDGAVIAVVDTGVNYELSDLKGQMWENPYEGKLAGTCGYDCVNGDADPMDDQDHGTHCAGVIAAANDGNGVTGIANKAKIMAVKGLDEDGSGYDEQLMGCMQYIYRAMKLGVNVTAINCSWGGYGTNDLYKDIIDALGEMGAYTCVAAGNESVDLNEGVEDDWTGETELAYPSCCGSDYAITVAAMNPNGEIASYSNYGDEYVDVAAEGSSILSTVSKSCFNPTIYTDQQKEEIIDGDCFDDMETSTAWASAMKVYKIDADGNRTELTGTDKDAYLSYTSDVYFGKETSGRSLKLGGELNTQEQLIYVLPLGSIDKNTYKALSAMFTYSSYEDPETYHGAYAIDVVADSSLDSVTVEDLYEDADISNQVGEYRNYWGHLQLDTSVSGAQSLVIGIEAFLGRDKTQGQDLTFYFDDLAMSQAVTTDSDGNIVSGPDFGNYDFYNGTSMATPAATAAVGALIAAGSTDVLADLIGNTQTVSSYAGKVECKGYLNFDSVNTTPIVSKVKVGSTVTLTGTNLSGCGVAVRSSGSNLWENVMSQQSEDGKSITFWAGEFANQLVDIMVTDGKTTITKEGIYLSIATKGFEKQKDTYFTDGLYCAATDGTSFYAAGTLDGNIYKYDPESNSFDSAAYIEDTTAFFDMSEFDSLTNTSFGYGSNMVYADGKFYIVGNMNEGVSSDTFGAVENAFYSQSVLLCFDPNEGEVTKVGTLPEGYDYVDGYSLGAYNGKVYLIGGYDYKAKGLSTKVEVFDPSTKKWTEGISLPQDQGRVYGSVVQVGNKLVYTLGGCEQGGVPANLVFDGTAWTVSKAQLYVYKNNLATMKFSSDSYQVVSGDVSATAGAVVYCDVVSYGYGDIFTYDPTTDEYTASDLTYGVSNYGDDCTCEVVGKTLYLMVYDDEAGWSANTAAVDSATVKATAAVASAYGTVTSASVLPGNKAAVKVTAKKGHYIKSITVNGTKTTLAKKRTVYTVNPRLTANAKVSVVYGHYVTKITPKKKTVTLKAGKKATLKYTIAPTIATLKTVSFTSSNKKFATVSAKGVVTAKKAGKGKTVKITIKAKDGYGTKAVVTIKIKK